MVSLRYFAPAEDVRDMASVYYLFDVDADEYADTERAAIAQLRFILQGNPILDFVDGTHYEGDGEGVYLVGPTTGAMKFTLRGPFRMFGIGLLPPGWVCGTKKSAMDYADKAVKASELFTPEIDQNMKVLRGCESAEEMVEWADKILRMLKPRVKKEVFAFTRMVDEWLSSEPSPPVSSLMERSPQSSRQVLRTVNKLYGMPPKYLARKYRALRAARAFAEGDEDELLELEDAFYDQSHMIREIKYFAGTTPTKLRVEEGEVATLMDQRKALKGQIPPIISDT